MLQPFQGWSYSENRTQGSSYLATLGWMIQRLWRCLFITSEKCITASSLLSQKYLVLLDGSGMMVG